MNSVQNWTINDALELKTQSVEAKYCRERDIDKFRRQVDGLMNGEKYVRQYKGQICVMFYSAI